MHHLSLARAPSPTGYPLLHVPISLFVGQIAWAWTGPSGNGTVMARQWLSVGLAVALVLHVLVATRGWCCLAEALLQAGWQCQATLLSHSPLLPARFTACGGLSTSLIHLRPALETSCATPTPPGQLHCCGSVGSCITKIVHCHSVVQMHLPGVGKGSDDPEKAAVSQEASASHSPEEAEVLAWIPYQASSPPMGTSAAAGEDKAPVTIVYCSTQGQGQEHLFSNDLHSANQTCHSLRGSHSHSVPGSQC